MQRGTISFLVMCVVMVGFVLAFTIPHASKPAHTSPLPVATVAQVDLIATSTPAPKPQPTFKFSRVEDAEHVLEPYFAATVEGRAINLCQYRDNRWADELDSNAGTLAVRIEKDFSDAEHSQLIKFRDDLAERMRSVLAPRGLPTPEKCRDLAQAGEPERLDGVALKLQNELQARR